LAADLFGKTKEMKMNLKNKPRLHYCVIEDYGVFAKQYVKDAEFWFDAFEKELRAIQKECEKSTVPAWWSVKANFIDEILGEGGSE
jgi:hypothetical protein